jgi:hypothetical protein
MAQGEETGWLGKLLAPYPLFLGVAVAFLSCCLLGFVSRDRPYVGFERFHHYINPQTCFYPTASQLRATARATLPPDRIAVVVGGNSVLNGAGQGLPLWTARLQELLGDEYRVINLAMCGAAPGEVGGVTAEMLLREYPRLILITNTWAGASGRPSEPDGSLHRYFFWDAYYKGLLLHPPDREERLREVAQNRALDDTYDELKRGLHLDAFLSYRDLWTGLAYSSFSTVWHPLLEGTFTQARARYVPDDTKPHASAPVPNDAAAVEAVRDLLRHSPDFVLRPEKNAGPCRVNPAYADAMSREFQLCYPAELRRRTLLVIAHYNPYRVQQLTAEEQRRYYDLFPATIAIAEAAGLTALEIGRSYTTTDYFDWLHFTRSGGQKLAEDLAPKVRQLARGLGYSR